MSKMYSKVYSGDTFRALMREYHQDRLAIDPMYRADYEAALQEAQHDSHTPSPRSA